MTPYVHCPVCGSDDTDAVKSELWPEHQANLDHDILLGAEPVTQGETRTCWQCGTVFGPWFAPADEIVDLNALE